MRKSGLAGAGPALLSVALTALALLPNSAAALTWGARVPVDPTNSYTAAIDCPTTSLCVVGGEGDRIATSTDPAGGAGTWSVGAVPGAIGGLIIRISCPSASLCVAVDGAGEALVSTNPAGGASTWTVTALPKAGGISVRGLSGLSCPSATLCVGVDRNHTDLLTGPPTSPATWSEIPLTHSPNDVSCTADETCVVAAGSVVYTTKTPSNAGSWAEAEIAPFNGSSYLDSVVSISCLPGLCVGGGAGGGGGFARVYWSQDPTGGKDKWSNEVLTSSLTNMDCVGQATTLCVGSSIYASFIWGSTAPTDGAGSWVATEEAANGGDTTIDDAIAEVSCPTTAACFAATQTGYVVMGTDTPGSGSGPVPGAGSGAGSGPGSAVTVGPPKIRFLKHSVSTNAIGFLLESAQNATGALSGTTADSYASASSSAVAARPKHAKRKHVSLGKVRFKLKAHTPKLVKLKIRGPIRELLAKHGKLKVKITIALKNADGVKSVTHKQLTLKRPRKHKSHT